MLQRGEERGRRYVDLWIDTAMTEVAGVEAEVVAPATLAGSEMPVVKGKGKKKKGKKP